MKMILHQTKVEQPKRPDWFLIFYRTNRLPRIAYFRGEEWYEGDVCGYGLITPDYWMELPRLTDNGDILE